MPLHQDAAEAILRQLRAIREGRRVSLISIGHFTQTQHRLILTFRREHGLEGGESPEIVYLGRHHYESRSRQGYGPDDMLRQIEAALAADSIPLLRPRMTAIQACTDRDDGRGCRVRDLAIFEMSARKPRAELFSVIPKGDGARNNEAPRRGLG